jgi:hypothetical protein
MNLLHSIVMLVHIQSKGCFLLLQEERCVLLRSSCMDFECIIQCGCVLPNVDFNCTDISMKSGT